MYLCDLRREQLLDLLPKGGEVAEVGVAEGTFSQEIISRVRPQTLHLIDPWEHQSRGDYADDIYGNVEDDEQSLRFEAVKRRFAAETESGSVRISRTYSVAAASAFRNGQLDWLYLDALHSFEAVSEDLIAYKDKVKADGFIIGHDYTNHTPAQNAGFGVVSAVNDFVVRYGFSVLALTMENFPTYVLAKDDQSAAAQQLLLKILYSAKTVVEVKNFPRDIGFRHHAVEIGGKQVVYCSLNA